MLWEEEAPCLPLGSELTVYDTMWCIIQQLRVSQNTLDLVFPPPNVVGFMDDSVMTSFKLTLLKTTSPFKLGARSMRIDGGK
jgi:hypothetical protein